MLHLQEMREMRQLDLSDTRGDLDKGLKYIEGMKQLRTLRLSMKPTAKQPATSTPMG